MAPLIHLYALFALATTVLASPHISRSVYNHAHRAVAHPPIDLGSRDELPLPRRKRSLNKRCVPVPTANSTTSAVSTTVLPSSAPINVAPIPSLLTSSAPPPSPSSSTSSSSAYVPLPPTTSAPSPSPSTEASSTSTPPPPPPPTTSSAAAPAQTSSSSSNSGQPSYLTGTQTGQGTYFSDGLGACGITNNDSQNIVAVAQSLFDSYPGYDGVNPNTNPVCGKTIIASYQGKSVSVTVTDRCTGCNTEDLDFSINAFSTLAALSIGRIGITWVWA